jgi:hypothetical protein
MYDSNMPLWDELFIYKFILYWLVFLSFLFLFSQFPKFQFGVQSKFSTHYYVFINISVIIKCTNKQKIPTLCIEYFISYLFT